MTAEITLLNPENGMTKQVAYKKGMTFTAPWFPMQIRQLSDKSGNLTPVKGSLGGIYRYLDTHHPTIYADYDSILELITVMGSPEQITTVLAEIGTFQNFSISFTSPSEVVITYDSTNPTLPAGPYLTDNVRDIA